MKLPTELVASLRPHIDGRRVCVTGGAGFIGGHTVDALVGMGATVSVIDDLSNSSSRHLTDLMEFEPDRIRFVQGSILDPRSLREAVDGCEAVVHLAAVGSVPRSIEDPQRTFAVNADGTVAVLQACRQASVKRLVFASSSSVYGANGGPAGTAKSETAVGQPESPYAASKMAAEAAVTAWARCYGIGAVSLRYFNVFGPRQPADSAYAAVVPAFIDALLHSKRPVIFGDGSASRDFTFVANVVAANLLAATTSAPLTGQRINIGTGRSTTILELARLLAVRCRAEHLTPKFEPARLGEVPFSLSDITLARSLLGYAPFVDLEGGLDETVNASRRLVGAA